MARALDEREITCNAGRGNWPSMRAQGQVWVSSLVCRLRPIAREVDAGGHDRRRLPEPLNIPVDLTATTLLNPSKRLRDRTRARVAPELAIQAQLNAHERRPQPRGCDPAFPVDPGDLSSSGREN